MIVIGVIFVALPLIAVIVCGLATGSVPMWMNAVWLVITFITSVVYTIKKEDSKNDLIFKKYKTKKDRIKILQSYIEPRERYIKNYIFSHYDFNDEQNDAYCEYVGGSLDNLSQNGADEIRDSQSRRAADSTSSFADFFGSMDFEAIGFTLFRFVYWGSLACGITTIPIYGWGKIPLIIGIVCGIIARILIEKGVE